MSSQLQEELDKMARECDALRVRLVKAEDENSTLETRLRQDSHTAMESLRKAASQLAASEKNRNESEARVIQLCTELKNSQQQVQTMERTLKERADAASKMSQESQARLEEAAGTGAFVYRL